MERLRIDKEHIVARYLADQLDAADREAFETHYTDNPEMVREIERTLRLKEGLAVLQERGELDSLMRTRRRWNLPLALAAAALLAAAGIWLWMAPHTPAPLAGELIALADSSGHAPEVRATYLLARARGASPALEIPLPSQRSAIELRMIPSARGTITGHEVALSRLEPEKPPVRVGRIHGLKTGDDGLVKAYLDTGPLRPGRYLIELSPEQPDISDRFTDRFVIDLR